MLKTAILNQWLICQWRESFLSELVSSRIGEKDSRRIATEQQPNDGRIVGGSSITAGRRKGVSILLWLASYLKLWSFENVRHQNNTYKTGLIRPKNLTARSYIKFNEILNFPGRYSLAQKPYSHTALFA